MTAVISSLIVITDDYSANPLTTGVVYVGEAKLGNINFAYDKDWVAVTLTVGFTYHINVNGINLADPILDLIGSKGDVLVSSDDISLSNKNSYINFTSQLDGNYYLAVRGIRDATGTYSVSVLNDDLSADSSTNATLLIGESKTGIIEVQPDEDWFAVSLLQGASYNFSLKGNTLADSVLSLLNSNGELITTNDDIYGGNLNSYVSFTADKTATYYLSAKGLRENTGSYTLSADLDDYSASKLDAGTLLTDGSNTGIIDSVGDKDWFAVSLTKGQTYNFTLKGNTLADSVLSLLNSNGNLITTNDDVYAGNVDSFINYTANTSGTYYLSAGGLRDKAGAYSISAALDDYRNDKTTTDSIAVNGSISGVIETANDQDVFSVSLVKGHTYNFNLNGDTLSDTVLSLLNANGDLITSNDDVYGGNLNSYINFTADATGTYYLSAKGLSDATGSYNLDISLDDYKSDKTTAGLIVDGVVFGAIEASGDKDWFAVSLDAGTDYQIDLKGLTLKDTILNLLDADGNLILSNDDVHGSLNSQIIFTPNQSDVYYLSASGYSDNAGTYEFEVAYMVYEGEQQHHVPIEVIGQP